MPTPLTVRDLGLRSYKPVFQAMQTFSSARLTSTPDELWLLQHTPVFTQGLNGKPEHLLNPGSIPVIPVDRGGQITYHGPGQLVVYCLLDIKRAGLGVRQLVTLLEQSVVALLATYGIRACARPEAPGVYVNKRKIAALGLRIRRQRCYHGLSLNVDMDLEPFERINPCGYPDLKVTQLKELGVIATLEEVSAQLLEQLASRLHTHIDHTQTELPIMTASTILEPQTL